jgi:hypothetical protein
MNQLISINETFFKNSIAVILFTLCAKNQPAAHWQICKQHNAAKHQTNKRDNLLLELQIIIFYSYFVSFKLTK